MDKNSLRRIIEDHIINLEGNAFQDFCDRLGLTLYPDDYTPVRAGGKHGDMKNDGYCPKARIFFAAHATRHEQISATNSKIKHDLEGCIQKHSNIKTWVYLTNDTLVGPSQAFIDQELRPVHTDIDIETWDHKKIATTIYDLPLSQIEYVLSMTLTTLGSQESIPIVDVTDIASRGGSEHFERFSIKNIGDEPAIDCRLSIIGDGYAWAVSSSRLPRTLMPGEELTEIEYKISDELPFTQEVSNLKVMLEYESKVGITIVTMRDLGQQRVPSGLFFNLKRGKFYSPTTIAPNTLPTVTLGDGGLRLSQIQIKCMKAMAAMDTYKGLMVVPVFGGDSRVIALGQISDASLVDSLNEESGQEVEANLDEMVDLHLVSKVHESGHYMYRLAKSGYDNLKSYT